jgi:chemotaxis protein MotB
MRAFGRRIQTPVNAWPGYVDALSALLMVVIFVVMIFTIVQFLLGDVIATQKTELSELHRQISELTRELGIARERGRELSSQVAELSGMLQTLQTERQELVESITALTARSESERERIEKQLRLIASLQEDIDALRKVRKELEERVGNLSASLEERGAEIASLRDRSKKLSARLADMEERTRLAQEEIEEKDIRIQALSAVVGEQREALEEQRSLTADARSQMALLRQRIEGLRKQLQEIAQALEAAEKEKTAQAAEIKDLGERLNIALARQVTRLNRYRSEFFGRLRQILSDVPYVEIKGDRFVFQAELLFASGSAELEPAGREHLEKLAQVLKDVAGDIPEDIDWVLRIDGHTDRLPIRTERFASNWELSAARAISVVKFLAEQGIPEKRLAAAGFSKYHPINPAHTEAAYRQNRRIEIKLTAR